MTVEEAGKGVRVFRGVVLDNQVGYTSLELRERSRNRKKIWEF